MSRHTVDDARASSDDRLTLETRHVVQSSCPVTDVLVFRESAACLNLPVAAGEARAANAAGGKVSLTPGADADGIDGSAGLLSTLRRRWGPHAPPPAVERSVLRTIVVVRRAAVVVFRTVRLAALGALSRRHAAP
jgi:hypothetical protein